MENKEQKSKRQLKIERTGWDAKHDYWHITTCILGHLNTFPEHEKTIFSSYDELYTAFAKTQGVEYTNYESFRAWLREGFLSKSNKIVRKSSRLKYFNVSDKQMEILFNDRPSKTWRKRMAKGRNQIVNGYPVDVPFLGGKRKKPSSRYNEEFLKKNLKPKTVNLSPQYLAYITSTEWRKKRSEALAHHGKKCSKCPMKTHLQVHHLSYKSLGNEPMEDLCILCKGCHQKEHGRKFD